MQPPLDKDGFLVNLDDWNKEVAEYLAAEEGISLTPEHWEIISALQDFYREFELSPAMRPLSKYLKQTLGNEKSGSIYLMKLFPGSPAKLAARIAGLPRPENCL
ncbi:MAG: sulfurtransferase TusE [Oceanospirillaceae bacterium]|uniref:TusE/DsrC/DsvC family sulfur relay protein n=1 Tax=unclassified Thalassolituus TaxID=2624967 RepID=UPI000C62133A|nr:MULTISPECIES: TusE/DsrC/DsvC family sulfur relay protein [unclassified Thalassolituus]MBL34615.1 sulfurtransferase TusE [Oceanospirillaceae bacterium]MBS54921.1 sulfurtransferase TusE [Oceanospirillaceae bacterium]|tara:strand:- start:1658 stop:1969 length:312 start_codon:yes stop_codon:yes gene_type:complete